MDKQSWKHGKEITSEEEYNEQTSALAEELQRIYTPSQVAEIAAQHMIYVDVLNSKPPMDKGFHSINEHYRSLAEQNHRLTLMFQTLVRNASGIIKMGVDGALQRASKKATDSRYEIPRERVAKAMEEWEASPLINRSEFARRKCADYGVTELTVKKWITKYEKAKKSKDSNSE
ncbi:hypothetical protein [Aeromonas sp. FDAARGOS 1418]|uniref:hypothetical protein n=1 Tax=Aeromonas TaxID=642 RepID=UPI001C223BFC|nr:hypothetical protein [Aeromonas sp. FDAARGOS 1418]QXB97571.1 hypothetical protein I6L48_10910 [Aeromonas sp. FDAARGOS 1418]